MALKDKLENISQQINVEKEEKKKNEESERLKPIREEIKKKEKEIFDLEIIKNSLDFKSEEKKGNQGMSEYAESTTNKKRKTKAELESIANANSEALEKMGVKNIDDLSSNPEFAEEEEVVAYREAEAQENDLILSDTKLKNRLAKLGIEINDDNFSYKTASEEISKRLDILNDELMAEKFKTPEGKEEAAEMLIKHFEKEIPSMKVNGMRDINLANGSESKLVSIEINNYENKFEIFRERADFKDNKFYNVLPKDFSQQADKYGMDFAAEALKKAYSLKIKESFLEADQKVNGNSREALEKLKNIGSEEQSKTFNLFRKFQTKKDEVLKMIDKKAEEAKEKGKSRCLDFDELRDMIKFDEYTSDETFYESISTHDFGHNFLPRYDYKKLQDAINRRIKSIEDFKQELSNFSLDEGQIDDRSMVFYRINKRVHSNNYKFNDIDCNRDDKHIGEFNDYYIAHNYFQNKINKFEDAEKKIAEKVSNLIELRALESELGNKLNEEANIQSIERKIIDKNQSIMSANQILAQIASAEIKLSEEKAELRGSFIHFPGRQEEFNKISQEIEKMKKELEEKKGELSREKNSEPKLFGKDKWRQRISDLENEIENSENKIRKEEKDKNLKQQEIGFAWTKLDEYPRTELREMVSEYKTSGASKEIFNELKQKLEEAVNDKIPEDVLEKYRKALDLRAKVNEKK